MVFAGGFVAEANSECWGRGPPSPPSPCRANEGPKSKGTFRALLTPTVGLFVRTREQGGPLKRSIVHHHPKDLPSSSGPATDLSSFPADGDQSPRSSQMLLCLCRVNGLEKRAVPKEWKQACLGGEETEREPRKCRLFSTVYKRASAPRLMEQGWGRLKTCLRKKKKI